MNRVVPGGKLSLFAFGSNDTLKVISNDPRQGNLDLGLEIGFHKVFAVWTQALGNWVNKLSPAYGYERLRFGAGALAINKSAHVLGLRDELSRQFRPGLTLRFGFDGEARFGSIFFNFPLVPETRLYGIVVPAVEPRTIPLDTLGDRSVHRRELGGRPRRHGHPRPAQRLVSLRRPEPLDVRSAAGRALEVERGPHLEGGRRHLPPDGRSAAPEPAVRQPEPAADLGGPVLGRIPAHAAARS